MKNILIILLVFLTSCSGTREQRVNSWLRQYRANSYDLPISYNRFEKLLKGMNDSVNENRRWRFKRKFKNM